MFWRKNNKRKVSNIVIDPAALGRFSIPLLIQLFVSVAVIRAIIWYISQQVVAYVESNGGSEHDTVFMQLLVERATVYGLVAMILLSTVTYLIFMIYSHRILGPTVAIRRHLAELLKGNYDARIKLRKNDEMKNVADDLNALAAKLKDERPASPNA